MKKNKKEKLVQIRKKSIQAKESKDGYSWTLAAVLGEALLMAEEMFGERDKSYTILGIDYTKKSNQCGTWFPGNVKHIIVQLSRECLTDRQDAYFQLCQCVVDLLSPTGKANANNLETGIGFLFAIRYMNYIFGDGFWNSEIPYRKRREAHRAVRLLLDSDPDAIKKLRTIEPTISRITSEQILSLYPSFPAHDAAFLARRF